MEILVVLLVLALLLILLLPAMARGRAASRAKTCSLNLRDIGTAYRLWPNDSGSLFPSEKSVAQGGWKDILASTNAAALYWTNYAIMQNELGQSPWLLICPEDIRTAAPSFTNKFGNLNISYFLGADASDVYPQSLLGGDRNLAPGLVPLPDYGFSPASGNGNDVAIPITSNTVCWSLTMHSHGSPFGAGNILLGDGSSQQTVSSGLRMFWSTNATTTTNWPGGRAPSLPSVRLVFP